MKLPLYIPFIALCIFLSRCQTNPKQADQGPGIPGNDDGLQQLQAAITEHPDSVRLYDVLIDTLTARKQYIAAAAWCDKLIGRGADSNYYYWFIKGDLLRRGQLYDSAIIAYQNYLERFPNDEQVLLNLANTYAEAGKKDAVDLSNLIAARYPTREMRSEAYFIKGVYFNQVKQYPIARKWFDSTIQLNYTFSEAYMEKGYSFYDEKKFKEAYQTFKTLAEINNSYADAWYWMAKSQEALGKKKEAISNYEHAFGLDHNISEAINAIDRLQKSTE